MCPICVHLPVSVCIALVGASSVPSSNSHPFFTATDRVPYTDFKFKCYVKLRNKQQCFTSAFPLYFLLAYNSYLRIILWLLCTKRIHKFWSLNSDWKNVRMRKRNGCLYKIVVSLLVRYANEASQQEAERPFCFSLRIYTIHCSQGAILKETTLNQRLNVFA